MRLFVIVSLLTAPLTVASIVIQGSNFTLNCNMLNVSVFNFLQELFYKIILLLYAVYLISPWSAQSSSQPLEPHGYRSYEKVEQLSSIIPFGKKITLSKVSRTPVPYRFAALCLPSIIDLCHTSILLMCLMIGGLLGSKCSRHLSRSFGVHHCACVNPAHRTSQFLNTKPLLDTCTSSQNSSDSFNEENKSQCCRSDSENLENRPDKENIKECSKSDAEHKYDNADGENKKECSEIDGEISSNLTVEDNNKECFKSDQKNNIQNLITQSKPKSCVNGNRNAVNFKKGSIFTLRICNSDNKKTTNLVFKREGNTINVCDKNNTNFYSNLGFGTKTEIQLAVIDENRNLRIAGTSGMCNGKILSVKMERGRDTLVVTPVLIEKTGNITTVLYSNHVKLSTLKTEGGVFITSVSVSYSTSYMPLTKAERKPFSVSETDNVSSLTTSEDEITDIFRSPLDTAVTKEFVQNLGSCFSAANDDKNQSVYANLQTIGGKHEHFKWSPVDMTHLFLDELYNNKIPTIISVGNSIHTKNTHAVDSVSSKKKRSQGKRFRLKRAARNYEKLSV